MDDLLTAGLVVGVLFLLVVFVALLVVVITGRDD